MFPSFATSDLCISTQGHLSNVRSEATNLIPSSTVSGNRICKKAMDKNNLKSSIVEYTSLHYDIKLVIVMYPWEILTYKNNKKSPT